MPYSEKVLEHFQHPRNEGSMADADAVGEVGNPVCGDVMKIYLKIRDRRIKDIKFETLGCAAAIAVSSALTEIAKGKSLDQALKIEKDDIVRELGGLPDLKIHCSMLGVEAMRAAIAKYQAGQK